MTIHEHIEHVIGKLPCDTLARHELVKLLVNLTSDMLWDMLGFFHFQSDFQQFQKNITDIITHAEQVLTSVTQGRHFDPKGSGSLPSSEAVHA